MGFGNQFSSESRTSSRTQTQSGPVTASGGLAQSLQQGGRSIAATQGATVLQRGASLGSTILTVGKGATVTFATDTNAISEAQRSIETILRSQSENAAATLASLGNLQTKPDPGQSTAGISPAVIAAAGGVLLLLAVLFLRKRS